MKNKKHFFINRIWGMGVLALLVLSVLTINIFSEDVILGVVMVLIDLICFVAILFFPPFFVIDQRGIRIHYFFATEEYLWKKVHSVEIIYDSGHGKSIPYIFDTFSIHGAHEGKHYFFMEGEIARSKRARRLIEKYSGKKIEGYFSDDVKAFVEKRRAKKEKKKKSNNKKRK